MWPIKDPILISLGKICNFRNPYLVTLYLCIYLILNEEQFNFHLQHTHSGTFANRKYEELSYSKNQKMCDPILVTLLKMRPHYSHPSRENGTPSSSTSPLASYKKVTPPGGLAQFCSEDIALVPKCFIRRQNPPLEI